MMGILHLKITAAYTHLFELVDDESKGFCATVMNMFDAMTLGITGFSYLFITKDGVKFTEIVNFVTSVLVILYLVLMPESPTWLLNNDRREDA